MCVCVCIHTHIYKHAYISCIHSSINGCLHCFHVLALVNNTAIFAWINNFWPWVTQPLMVTAEHVAGGVTCFPTIQDDYFICSNPCTTVFSHSVLLFSCQLCSDSLWTHGLQHARLPCPSPFPRACSNSYIHWVTDAIQLAHPLSSLSPPAFSLSQHQSFPMSQLFASGGQSIGASASASVLPMNIQGWFPLGLTGLIS